MKIIVLILSSFLYLSAACSSKPSEVSAKSDLIRELDKLGATKNGPFPIKVIECPKLSPTEASQLEWNKLGIDPDRKLDKSYGIFPLRKWIDPATFKSRVLTSDKVENKLAKSELKISISSVFKQRFDSALLELKFEMPNYKECNFDGSSGADMAEKFVISKQKYYEEKFKTFLENYTVYIVTNGESTSGKIAIEYAEPMEIDDLIPTDGAKQGSEKGIAKPKKIFLDKQFCTVKTESISNSAFAVTNSKYFYKGEVPTLSVKAHGSAEELSEKLIGLVVVDKDGDVLVSQKLEFPTK
jgi:hypothetical protein